MRISRLCVKRPLSTLMVMLLVVLIGGIAVTNLPIDLFPDIEQPVLVVTTKYNGASPKEVESLVTKPLEEVLSSMKSLKSIKSQSIEGKSVITMSFNYGINMNYTSLEAREKIDLVSWFLPDEVSSPKVQKFNPNAKPIVQVAFATDDVNAMKKQLKDNLKPALERVDGVAAVKIVGGQENEIEIALDKAKIENYGLTVSDVSDALNGYNKNWPDGKVKKGNQELMIRTVGRFKTLADIRNMTILLPTNEVVYLDELSDLRLKAKEKTSEVKLNQEDSVSLLIQKQSGANTVRVGKLVKEELKKLKGQYPEISGYVVSDQSKDIQKLINNIVNTVLLGGVLAVAVLYIFLKNIKTTFIIGISLPISVVATFMLLYFNNITINMMTLGGLALGGGMLVDNSIVVLENIFRYRQMGYEGKEAAVKGAEEVALSVIASTLTTVVVFIPIIFLEGMIASLFRTLALTVTFSLMSSLVVALTVIPMLSSKLLSDKDSMEKKTERTNKSDKKSRLAKLDAFINHFNESYAKRLKWSLNNGKRVMIISGLVFILSYGAIAFLDTGFFPKIDEGRFMVEVTMPRGTRIEEGSKTINQVESKLRALDQVTHTYSVLGSDDQNNSKKKQGSESAKILVITTPFSERKVTLEEIITLARTSLKDVSGISYKVAATSLTDVLSEGERPIDIQLYANDFDVLEETGEKVATILKDISGVTDVDYDRNEGAPEIQIIVDPFKATTFGLTASEVGRQVQERITGASASKFKSEGREIDIIVKGKNDEVKSVTDIEQLALFGKKNVKVLLGSIATIDMKEGPSAIYHQKQKRVLHIQANLSNAYYADVMEILKTEINKADLPEDVVIQYAGNDAKIKENVGALLFALAFAVILVYMILASQFESLLNPFIIMLAVPLSFGGGLMGLLLFGQTLSVPAMIGAIVLSGVVVNDSILLIDCVDMFRKEGLPREEAILKAGPIRLRPILMTTLTTILGLLPMLLSSKAAMLSPMAAVVIGGLILADILILVLIPVMYIFFDDLNLKLQKRFGFGPKEV